MLQDTQKVIDAEIEYMFYIVKCTDCGESSDQFLYQERMSADEKIAYILENTKFRINKDEGGLRCAMCDRKNRVREVNDAVN